MFKSFFGKTLEQFSQGEFGFESAAVAGGFALLAAAVILLVIGVYLLSSRYPNKRTRAISLLLRSAAIALLSLPLLGPVLVTPDVVPDENFVAVIVDSSESMGITDGADGATRSAEAAEVLLGESGIVPGLEEHFQIRYYTIGEEVSRVDSLGAPPAAEAETNLTVALDRMLTDFRGIPLAGVVMLTDGGDNSSEVPLTKAEELRAAGIPLHIVGVGQESFETEREILDVNVAKAIEENTGADIDVTVRSWGRESGPVAFSIYQGTERVFTETRRLKGEGKVDQLSFFFEPSQSGAEEYRIEIAAAEDELNDANNSQEMLIDTRSDTTRVLYLEGSLRQEFKFSKRALEDDQVVDFVSIARNGTQRYYRQGVRGSNELVGGFARDESELFGFKAIIMGDIEASAYSLEQLRMIESFVRTRGGGFLMLGGRNTFADGDYWNTPVSELLPVQLDVSRKRAIPDRFYSDGLPSAQQGFRFEPTAEGIENPILKLSPEKRSSLSQWSGMPGLTSINYLGQPKPGAVVLAQKPKDQFGNREPLLVAQRYGRGRSAALATSSTWRWQMHLEADDARHERFWRQLVRWLVASAPEKVNISVGTDRPEPGDEVDLGVSLFDDRYSALEEARVEARVEDPFGITTTIELQEELSRPGSYTSTFVPRDEGVYEIRVVANGSEGFIGEQIQHVLVRPSKKEFFNATMRRPFLEDLAEVNGGAFYTTDNASLIPDRLRTRRTSSSIFRSSYIWDMPALFALILLLFCAEWWFRRRRGLA